jgi:murein L,D-transpeptidase YcbB/YkuD
MRSGFFVFSVTAVTVISVALFGCKGKVEKAPDETVIETASSDSMPQSDAMLAAQAVAQQTVVEPSQGVATETIPPTAAVQQAPVRALPAAAPLADRNRDVQTALKNAGFYGGSVDGKIGPKTKAAIQEFQKAKGLKVDGKVGPKTWAEMEKYLLRQ